MPSLAATAPTVYSGLTERARAVLYALERHDKRRTGKVWPSINRLAAIVGMCRRTVERGISDLIRAGLILKHKRHRRANVYTIVRPALQALCQDIAEAINPSAPERPRSATKRPEPQTPTVRAVARESHRRGSGKAIKTKSSPGVSRERESSPEPATPPARPPTLADVQDADLADADRTHALFEQAARAGLVPLSEWGRLLVFTAAAKALRIGRRPAALFAGILRRKLTRWTTAADEDEAVERIKAREHRARWQHVEAQRAQERRLERDAAPPPLSKDAALWGHMLDTLRGNEPALRGALRSKGWTPERIEAAAIASDRTVAWRQMGRAR